ncbi:hypothetical protein BC827DRAFT_1255434 [Russula dissimulans]|nr:hypothetical protein BC827DRAFT_1255434 [Russula dissimulans]
MTSGNLSRSLLLGISERDRDILTLTEGHRQPLARATQSPPLPHLPEVQISAQYFIDMGLTPTTAERLLLYFSKFVIRYRQNFEFYFGRVIQGGSVLPPTYYHDTFVPLYKRTIKSWESQIMSTVRVWLHQTGAFSPDLRKECLDVSRVIGPYPVFVHCWMAIQQIHVDDATKNSILSKLGFLITPLLSSKCGTSHGVVTPRLEEVCEKDDSLLTKPANHYVTVWVFSSWVGSSHTHAVVCVISCLLDGDCLE